jgi:hypothetical protein
MWCINEYETKEVWEGREDWDGEGLEKEYGRKEVTVETSKNWQKRDEASNYEINILVSEKPCLTVNFPHSFGFTAV